MSNIRPAGLSDDEEYDEDYYCSSDSDKDTKYAKHSYHQEVQETKESLFYKALKNGEIDTLKSFLASGFHVDQPLAGGWSPLMHACLIGSLPIVQVLVEAHANVNFNKELYTPLMALCNSTSNVENELVQCMDLLLNNGANVNATDRHNTTALMNASSLGHLELVKKLIQCNCDVNIQNSEGWSALFHAINEGREDVVRVLIEGKARLDLIDRRRRSPYDLAVAKGHDYLYQLVCSKKEMRRLMENKQDLSLPHVIVKDPVENLMNQLPNSSNSLSGFSSDVGKMLWAMGLKHFIKLFNAHNIQLNDFLLITDERLLEVGVRFSMHRQQILNCLKKFHIHKWTKASLGLKPRNQQMDLDDGIKLMCNVTKHLHILNATLSYVHENQPVPPTPGVFQLCENALHQINLIRRELKAIELHAIALKNKEKVEPTDLITGKQNTGQRSYVFFLLPTVFIGFVLWRKQAYFN